MPHHDSSLHLAPRPAISPDVVAAWLIGPGWKFGIGGLIVFVIGSFGLVLADVLSPPMFGWPSRLVALGALISSSLGATSLLSIAQLRSPRQSPDRDSHFQRLEMQLNRNEQERRLIGYELHDGLMQEILCAQMYLESIDLANQPSAAERLHLARDILKHAITEGRQFCDVSTHTSIFVQGVEPALREWLAVQRKRHGLSIHFTCELPLNDWELRSQRLLFRLVQEGCTNIRRHSGTLSGKVSLKRVGRHALLQIADQGVGFEPRVAERGSESFGLAGMRERTAQLGGSMTCESTPGRGTTLSIRFPLPI